MNIYYAHCAVLIKVAEFNLKMSRSYCRYDEDWQRRKSILIRSLFHDLPILSPVSEESDDSYVPVRSYEPLEEPQRPYSPLPPLMIERVPKINKHDEPDEYYKKLLIKIKRIYRRLFILNRNLSSDEEFFSDGSMTDDNDDLNTSLAIKNDDNHVSNSPDNPLAVSTDNHGLDSHIIDDINDPVDQAEEFNDLDDNKDDSQSQVNDNTNSNEENVRKSSASNASNGYRADSESIDTVIVDILNYTKSTNGEASTNTKEDSKASKDLEEESESIGSEGEDESNTDNNEERLSANEKASDNESSSTTKEDYSEELTVSEEESNVSLTSNQETNENFIPARRNEIIISNIEEMNEQEMIGEESDDKSITNQGVKTKSSSTTDKNIQESQQQEELLEIRSEEEIKEKRITEQSSKSSSVTEERNVSHQEGTNTLRQEPQNRFVDLNKSRMNIKTANEDESDNSSTSDEEWDGEESESLEVEISVELSASALEEIKNVEELEGEGRRIAVVSPEPEIMDDDAVEVVSDIGSHYRQITTVALVHADVPQDLPETESQVYEGSPKSIILPVKRMKRTAAQAVLDRREELVGVGRNKEPRAEAVTHSNSESSENIEEMRSHTRKLSQATNPEISQESVSEKSNEFVRNSHDVTDVTSSPQDGGNFNISKRKTSDDLGEVLARILNESRDNVENINLCRKRKNFEDISVQTSKNLSWDDIRKELFVGAPKIMRLCSCVDHVCQ